MKYGRTAWVTAQGMVLIAGIGYGLFFIRQRFVNESHQMSPQVFGILTCVVLSLAVSFASRRALSEVRRAQRGGGSR
jgi:hypothetical protein